MLPTTEYLRQKVPQLKAEPMIEITISASAAMVMMIVKAICVESCNSNVIKYCYQ